MNPFTTAVAAGALRNRKKEDRTNGCVDKNKHEQNRDNGVNKSSEEKKNEKNGKECHIL